MNITTPDGRAVRVKRLGPGDHFGYDALLASQHDTTVSCLTDVEVTAVPQDELRLASNRDASGYLEETMIAQKGKAAAAASTAAAGETEAQILPMMAKAAVEGGGSVEYDKYGQMLAQVKRAAEEHRSSSKAPPLPLVPPLPPPPDTPSFLPLSLP